MFKNVFKKIRVTILPFTLFHVKEIMYPAHGWLPIALKPLLPD